MRLRIAHFIALALLASGSLASAQTWEAYPAFRDVRAIAASDDAIWAATPAGVFSATLDNEFDRYTTVDGLQGGDIGAITVDARGRVWVGYASGVLDRIDPSTGDVRSYFEIERADQYTSKGINRIRPRGDLLLIATDFGLVIFDTARDEVRQTAARLGDIAPATPVMDVIVAPSPDGSQDLYWLATNNGIVTAPLASENIQFPSAWSVDSGFEGEAYSLAAFDGTVWAGGRPGGQPGDIYRRSASGVWERRAFLDGDVVELVPTANVLYGVVGDGENTYALEPGVGNRFYVTFPQAPRLQSITLGPDGRVWAGDSGTGLFRYPALSSQTGRIDVVPGPILPSGPFANQIVSVDVGDDGTVWTATRSVSVGVSNTSGVSWLKDGVWQTVRADDPGTDLPERDQVRVVARGDGAALVGSAGRGMAVVSDDGAVATFDEANSSLRPVTSTNDFVVISDFVAEGDRWWVLNKSSPLPLHAFPGTAEAQPQDWTGLPGPPGGPSGVGGNRIVLDGFGQKWITLGDRGLLVWDTGADPLSPVDDRGRTFSVGLNGQGLPNGNVTAVVKDVQDRMWIGTRRGLAVVFSPGSAFGGDPALAEPVWPTTGEGDNFDYLLRDSDVTDLALDPAGRIWVGTTTGAYLLSPEGDAVELRLGADNSPLPTDAIVAISIDEDSGRVYLATASGLYSYGGDATGPQFASEALRVGPNPFRPSEHDGVTIAGLNARTNRVRVLTLDGRTVFESDAVFGGSFRWNGRDARTGDLVPSGVYLVAASGDNGEKTIYGKVAVIQ